MLKHYVGVFVSKVRRCAKKRIDRHQVFFSAVLRLGAKLCKADGRISADEIRAFKSTFEIGEQSLENAARIFKEAAVSPEAVEEIAGEVFSLVGNNPELLEYIVVGLMQVAAADGSFHKLEASLNSANL